MAMARKQPSFTIGADPELFLVSADGKKYISSIGKIGGSKDCPAPIGGMCAVQEDNVAVEFNIPPAANFESFKSSIDFSLTTLKQKAEALNLRIAIDASAEFDPDQLNTPAARVFGCDPDFNAWTHQQNPRPVASNKSLRSCGGHVHVGTDANMIDVIRAMDLFLGCPSTILDKDTRRRELYGKAGAYRPKGYGGEYRALSNFWIKSSDLMEWVYNQTKHAIEWVEENTTDGSVEWPRDIAGAIQSCINDNNKDAYMFLDKKYNFGL